MLLDRAIAGCLADEVDEIVVLGNTLKRWRTQILAHHLTGASNGPTEAMNLLVRKIKRRGQASRAFATTAHASSCTAVASNGTAASSGHDNAGPFTPVGRVEPNYSGVVDTTIPGARGTALYTDHSAENAGSIRRRAPPPSREFDLRVRGSRLAVTPAAAHWITPRSTRKRPRRGGRT
jgi:hypothetical protein